MKKLNSGFLITELLVTFVLLGMMLTCFTILLGSTRDLGRYNLCRQHCIQAAVAQLECVAITGKPLPDDRVKSLWNEVTTQIEITGGTEQWQGLKLVKVKSTAYLGKKEIAIELARYIYKNGE